MLLLVSRWVGVMVQATSSEHMARTRGSGLTVGLVGSSWIENFMLHPEELSGSWYLEAMVELQSICRPSVIICAWGLLGSIPLSLDPADKPLFELTVVALDLASLVFGIILCSCLTYQSLVSIVNMAACWTDNDVSGWAFCLQLYIEIFQLYKVFTVIAAIDLMPVLLHTLCAVSELHIYAHD